MVILMEDDEGERTVVVDQQGRMVLPSRLRERLGLKKGGRVSIRLEDSSKVVIERKSAESVEERVENWVSMALNAREQVSASSGKRPMASKWMSSEYARRKLGI
jgi:AbrB family looped-hinge helix DNA binding protein